MINNPLGTGMNATFQSFLMANPQLTNLLAQGVIPPQIAFQMFQNIMGSPFAQNQATMPPVAPFAGIPSQQGNPNLPPWMGGTQMAAPLPGGTAGGGTFTVLPQNQVAPITALGQPTTSPYAPAGSLLAQAPPMATASPAVQALQQIAAQNPLMASGPSQQR